MDSRIFGIWRTTASAAALPASLPGRDDIVVQTGGDSGRSLLATAPSCVRQDSLQVLYLGQLRANDGRVADEDAARWLLQAYRETGGRPADCPALLARIHGDFALALIDEANQCCVLAVDPMGIRSLSYCLTADGRLIFGESALEVAGHSPGGARLDPQAMFDYLHFHMIPSPTTAFRDVFKLQPGKCLQAQSSGISVHRYWQPDFAAQEQRSFADLAAGLHAALEQAVANCCPDAATGAFLSGGLDSSSLVGKLAGRSDGPVNTFSIGFDAEGFDELRYARETVRHFGAAAHEVTVTPADILEIMPLVASTYDEPFGNSSAVPTYACARLAKNLGMHRLVAGDGGDELFAGNPHYTRQKLFEYYWSIPQGLRRGLLEPAVFGLLPENAPWPLGKLRSYVQQARIPLPDRLHSWNYVFRHATTDIFSADFLHDIDRERPHRLMRESYDEAGDTSVLNKLLFFDWKFVLADTDLRKVGRMCRLAGIDVSYPMLDPAVIELSLQVPDRLKIHGQTLRYFFKAAMRDFLPEMVISKPKHGFGLPFGQWLKTHPGLRQLVHGALRELDRREFLRTGFVDELIAHHESGHPSYYGYVIWDLAMLELWMQSHHLNP